MQASVWLFSTLLITQAPTPAEPLANRPGEAALDEFRATMDESGEQLTRAIDAAAETLRKRRNITTDERLAALNDLQRQKDLFAQQSVVPKSTVLQGATTRYCRTMEQAATRLDRALKPVIDDLVKGGRPEEANRVQSERSLLVVGPGHELVGRWRLQEGRGSHGYRERFLIDKQFGHWTLQRAFIDSAGRTAGDSSGSDFSFSGGTLTYTENYRKKPHDTWDDRCSFTIQRADGDGEVLSVRWETANGRAGTLALVREE